MSYNPDLGNYDAQAFALAAHNVWVTRVCQLCPCIIFCYDYLLTLDREVEFIWVRLRETYAGFDLLKNTIVETADEIFQHIIYHCEIWWRRTHISTFILVSNHRRMTSFSAFMSKHTSKEGGPVSAFFGQFNLRVYALYRRSLAVLIAMAVGFTIEVIVMSIFLGIGMAENTSEPLPNIRICAVTHAPPVLAYVWLPDIVFGTFLFVLAGRIGFKRGRFGFNIFRMERKDLVDALVYGNLHYFLCILVANVVNTGIWQGLGFSWFEAPEGFAAVIEIILGCRMVLDLNSAVSDSDGLRLLDSFPLKDSFGAREGPSTLYSAVSTYDLETSQGQNRLTQEIELASPTSPGSGESSRVLIEGANELCSSPLPTVVH
ncbi:hypothetical protein BDR06DRAFT_1007007 [Suillus hirtellus]|nr:hypothetical protein BDR06DRAFT_1007007 [Suillus hirtellus]